MLFFVAEEVELRWVVLEEMGTYAISNACAATCDDVGLAAEVGNVLVRIEGVFAEHCSGCCGKLIAGLFWLSGECICESFGWRDLESNEQYFDQYIEIYKPLLTVVILPAERCSRSDVNTYIHSASIMSGEGMALGCRSAEEVIGELCELSLGS